MAQKSQPLPSNLSVDSNRTEPSDDTSSSLRDIRSRLSAPICSTLLEIQKYQLEKGISSKWVEDLKCINIPKEVEVGGQKRRKRNDGEAIEIKPPERILEEKTIHPLNRPKDRKYIAVSWVWEEPDEEPTAVRRYLIKGREASRKDNDDVRDIVLERVIKYADSIGFTDFWIDKLCIKQKDEEQKKAAIQAMDLVYSLSQKSLAIINKHIKTEEELNLLAELMNRELVDKKDSLVIFKKGKADKVLKLVKELTSASWWNRAWTFQEDYKAGINMVLLISHVPSLKRLKESKEIFEDVPGELCINSVKFRTEVTRFCQAYKQRFGSNQRDVEICDKIVETAGQYNILLREKDKNGHKAIRKPMSPMILADIVSRGISKPWDRLAIAANCSSYDVRFNVDELRDQKFSLSLAMLTQHLLNGEIIDNRNTSRNDFLITQKISDFLKSKSLDTFDSPVTGDLTFIKGCRFPEVELLEEGVQTSGLLWKLGKRIKAKLERKLSFEKDTPGGLTGCQRYRLKQLANELGTGEYESYQETLTGDFGIKTSNENCHESLADELFSYLDEERGQKDTLAKEYKYWMASEIYNTLKNPEKVLRLACLIDTSNNEHSPYLGIFVCDADVKPEPAYVFTAWRQSKGELGDIDKYVSLEVELLNPNAKGIPQLVTKRWINGLYFAFGQKNTKVVFPWMEILKV